MKFTPKLLSGRFKRRYKRFFADIQLDTGELVVAHCPNTGSMKNCLVENSPCWLSKSDNPKRKLEYTLEAVTATHGGMAGINTGRTNKLVEEALMTGRIAELAVFDVVEREVGFGKENSRLDFRLSKSAENQIDHPANSCFVEVKNLSLGLAQGVGMFPDAVTTRGAKHLRELALAKSMGHRAVLFFCVQHTQIDRVRPATHIDSNYAQTLREVCDQGVEVLAYSVSMNPSEFILLHRLPFSFD